ncbi:MAG: hypothetical protein LUC95_08210 [Lachnospiraceae bacterium]|nr:hypothetical protein [Lachnospiraceae bacterium]
MPDANNEAQCFYQNLIDIGLGEETISHCVFLKKEGRSQELLLTLQNSRKTLLDQIHTDQKRLDCLDYLVCRLSKKGGKP